MWKAILINALLNASPFLDAHLFARGTDFVLDTFHKIVRSVQRNSSTVSLNYVFCFPACRRKSIFPVKLNLIQYIWKKLIQTGSKSFILSGSSIISDWKVLASIRVLIFQQQQKTTSQIISIIREREETQHLCSNIW